MPPIDFDAPRTPAVTASHVGGPSAVMELSGLFCAFSKEGLDIPVEVVDAANAFWSDGFPFLTEPLALAHATGHVHDEDLTPLLDRLLEPVPFSSALPLETETAEERDATNARLARLARDKRLRARYADVLSALWTPLTESWQSTDTAAVRAAQHDWQARLEAGEDVIGLLPDRHIARREERFTAMVRAAWADGTLLLSPTTTGRHIVALPGLMSVSAQIVREDAIVAQRRAADAIAQRLRPLVDPTRLTILAQLAHAPSGVSDLARTLHVAQPTASVHLRQLREAGLVTTTRDGARTTYRVAPGALEELLGDVSARLIAQVDRSGGASGAELI